MHLIWPKQDRVLGAALGLSLALHAGLLSLHFSFPEGVRWKPEFKGRSVVPGDGTRIRQTFKRENEVELKRIEVRSEGMAIVGTSAMGDAIIAEAERLAAG